MSNVTVNVGIRSTVNAGLAKIRGQFKEFRKHLNSDIANVFTGAALIEGVKELMDELDRVKDLSVRFGESAESIQRVDEAAKIAGSDIEIVAKSIGKVSLAALKAARDGGPMADAFKSVGINVQEFIEAPLEKKLLMLSEAYQKASNSTEGLARMQELLGKGAGELIPLIAEGPEKLQASFDEAHVSAQNVVDAVDEFNDTLTKMKGYAASTFGFIIQLFMSVGKTVGGIIGTIIGAFEVMFNTQVRGWSLVGDAAKAAMTGNLKGVKDALSELPSVFAQGIKDLNDAIDGGSVSTYQDVRDVWTAKPAFTGPKGSLSAEQQTAAEEAKDAAEEQAKLDEKMAEETKKRDEDIASLKQKIADAERERLLASMTVEERINELIKERAALMEDAGHAEDDKQALEDQLEIARINQEIDRSKKEQASEDQKKAEDLASAQEKLAEAQKRNQYESLKSPEERLKFMREELSKLDAQIKKTADPKENVDLRIKREEKLGDINKEIDEQRKAALQRATNVVGDSLAEIGGGGNVSAVGSTVDPIVNKIETTNDWLRQIYEQGRFSGVNKGPDLMKE